MSVLINARALSKRYHQLTALDDIHFEIGSGRIVGLLGPNGSGKSTLLKAILGFIRVQGQLEVLGLEPRRQRRALMEQVCFIADTASLPRWLRVHEAIDFLAHVHPHFDRTKCAAYLARTKISHHQFIKHLSKGMVVQLHLALVMAIDARLLILDEPTLGLDILYRKQFYEDLVQNYANEHKTMIIATHQVEEVEHILTDLMFVRDGHMVLNMAKQNIGQRFVEVLVEPEQVAAAQALKPYYQRQAYGKNIFLFDGMERAALAPLGEMRCPSVSDLFVAVMHGAYS